MSRLNERDLVGRTIERAEDAIDPITRVAEYPPHAPLVHALNNEVTDGPGSFSRSQVRGCGSEPGRLNDGQNGALRSIRSRSSLRRSPMNLWPQESESASRTDATAKARTRIAHRSSTSVNSSAAPYGLLIKRPSSGCAASPITPNARTSLMFLGERVI
jgi:hypothetical protein